MSSNNHLTRAAPANPPSTGGFFLAQAIYLESHTGTESWSPPPAQGQEEKVTLLPNPCPAPPDPYPCSPQATSWVYLLNSNSFYNKCVFYVQCYSSLKFCKARMNFSGLPVDSWEPIKESSKMPVGTCKWKSQVFFTWIVQISTHSTHLLGNQVILVAHWHHTLYFSL